MGKRSIEKILQKISSIVIISIIITGVIFLKINHIALGDIIFYDVIPFYSTNKDLVKIDTSDDLSDEENIEEPISVATSSTNETELIGLDDIIFEENSSTQAETVNSNLDISKLSDLSYLKQKFYIVDSKTDITTDYFDVEKFLTTDLSIEKSLEEPKVLIFHTHSQEMFADSDTSDINEGIVGAGARLANLLENTYGVKTLHVIETFDVVNGSTQITGAYERMEPVIRKILEENPSIELVLDLHRDGVSEGTRLVTEINGKTTAQIMYFNGICRIYENGVLNDIDSLQNPYIDTNLALSFNMQKKTLEKYENFSRRIYINAYRYSLHMLPKSMLIEVGAQTNTKEEIYNAIDILAELINEVVFES